MLLIKNVQIIDGTNQPPFKSDVLVKKEKILQIGSIKPRKSYEVIDAMGAYLTPGFIDVHSSADHHLLFFKGGLENYLLHGITTVIGGQDGVSLAPLIYGSIDLIKKFTDTKKINVSWHSLKEFIKVFANLNLALNFGTLVGYQTVKNDLTGGEKRDLTAKEQKLFQFILRRSLKDGAFGLSIDLDDSKPSYYELKLLGDAVKDFKALYATSLDRSFRRREALKKIIYLTENTGTKTFITHIPFNKLLKKQIEEIIKIISSVLNRADIFFEVYCSKFNRQNILRAASDDRALVSGYDCHLSDKNNIPFSRLIKDLSSKNILPVETSVAKLTSVPAGRLSLKDRGFIKPGYFADLLVLRDGEVREVILNGRRAVQDGKFQGIFVGKFLKRT